MAAVSLCWDTKTTRRHVKTLYKTKTYDSLWPDQETASQISSNTFFDHDTFLTYPL